MKINYDAKDLHELGDAEFMQIHLTDQMKGEILSRIYSVRMTESRMKTPQMGAAHHKDKHGNVLFTIAFDLQNQVTDEEKEQLRKDRQYLENIEAAAKAYKEQSLVVSDGFLRSM